MLGAVAGVLDPKLKLGAVDGAVLEDVPKLKPAPKEDVEGVVVLGWPPNENPRELVGAGLG